MVLLPIRDCTNTRDTNALYERMHQQSYITHLQPVHTRSAFSLQARQGRMPIEQSVVATDRQPALIQNSYVYNKNIVNRLSLP